MTETRSNIGIQAMTARGQRTCRCPAMGRVTVFFLDGRPAYTVVHGPIDFGAVRRSLAGLGREKAASAMAAAAGLAGTAPATPAASRTGAAVFLSRRLFPAGVAAACVSIVKCFTLWP